MQVKSIAETSTGTFNNTFDLKSSKHILDSLFLILGQNIGFGGSNESFIGTVVLSTYNIIMVVLRKIKFHFKSLNLVPGPCKYIPHKQNAM